MITSESALPFTVQRLDHLVLRVQDLNRSVLFYTRVLGCHVARTREELGMVHLSAGASMIDVIGVDGPLGRSGGAVAADVGRNVDHFCLRIEPFDEAALMEHLSAHGVLPQAPAQPRFGSEGTGPSLYLRDPDGNVVELKGPPTSPR